MLSQSVEQCIHWSQWIDKHLVRIRVRPSSAPAAIRPYSISECHKIYCGWQTCNACWTFINDCNPMRPQGDSKVLKGSFDSHTESKYSDWSLLSVPSLHGSFSIDDVVKSWSSVDLSSVDCQGVCMVEAKVHVQWGMKHQWKMHNCKSTPAISSWETVSQLKW